MLSQVAKSNLFTKAVAAKHDPRQNVPEMYAIPNAETRLLLARLVFEEAMETIAALGCYYSAYTTKIEHQNEVFYSSIGRELDIDDIIDGACDTIYVATGVLCAIGAPDMPHLHEVCCANDRKFPNGNAIINPETGKYLKPEGWFGPDHKAIREHVLMGGPNLRERGQQMLAGFSKDEKGAK